MRKQAQTTQAETTTSAAEPTTSFVSEREKQLQSSPARPFAIARGGAGKAIPETVRQDMGALLNADFSTVRVHESDQPERIGAVAYAFGNDIHFSPGSYRPRAKSGRALLAHELSHVVQQREGTTRRRRSFIGIPIDHSPKLEREADGVARRAVLGTTVEARGERDTFTGRRDGGAFQRNERGEGPAKEARRSATVPARSPSPPQSLAVSTPVVQMYSQNSSACYIPSTPGPFDNRSDNNATIQPGSDYSNNRATILNQTGIGQGQINLQANGDRWPNHQTQTRGNFPGTANGGPVNLTRQATFSDHLLNVDHIFPENLGGGNSIKNAQFASAGANSSKGDEYSPCPLSGRTGTRILLPKPVHSFNAESILSVNGNGGGATVNLPNGTTLNNLPAGFQRSRDGLYQENQLLANTPLLADSQVKLLPAGPLPGNFQIPSGTRVLSQVPTPPNGILFSGVLPQNLNLPGGTNLPQDVIIAGNQGDQYPINVSFREILSANTPINAPVNAAVSFPGGTAINLASARALDLAPQNHDPQA